MKSIILVCAVCLGVGESYRSDGTEGVGAFSYDGPEGRYGGTYGLKDGQVVNKQGTFPPDFSPPAFPDYDNFIPEYFSNLENLLEEAFIPQLPFFRSRPFHAFRRPKPHFRRTFDNVENQRLAFAAATKAFDLTTNRAGSNQYIAPSRYGGNFPAFGGFQGNEFQGFPGQGYPGQGFPGQRFPGQDFAGFNMDNFHRNMDSAFAGAAIGPDFTHQVAGISPANPNNPNVNKYSNVGGQPGGFKSVMSSASVSSSNIDGKKTSTRRAQTIINDNGAQTIYKVES